MLQMISFLFYLVPASYLLQGVSHTPRVEVDYDQEFDFSDVDSFAWSTTQQSAPNPADHIRITKAVSDRLEELGFTADTKDPDVRVLYRLDVEEKTLHVDSRQRITEWDPTDVETTVSFGSHKEAYLVVEMFDSETGKRIWRAKCAHMQPTADKVERSLYDTVKHVFEVYPTNDKDR